MLKTGVYLLREEQRSEEGNVYWPFKKVPARPSKVWHRGGGGVSGRTAELRKEKIFMQKQSRD